VTWQGGEGDWGDIGKWGGRLPAVNSFAAIEGDSHVALNQAHATVSRLDLGTERNADVSLTMHEGSLAVVEFIRLAENAGSHGKFVLRGGRVCTTEVAVSAMNEGEGVCRAELEVHGGRLLTRYLTLGYRAGSTAQLRVVGSGADCIVALNSVDCSIPTGAVGSTCQLRFDIDGTGVTPLVLWNKRESIRLARKDRASKCFLRVSLLEAPPAGDITLVHGFQPCQGTFHGFPEGSLIRAEHGGQTYDWRLTYRGGSTKCDIVLGDPHVRIGAGLRVAYRGGKLPRSVAIEPAVIRAAWEDLYRQVDRGVTPLGSGTRAFPGAEGYGAFAKGGRGGKVLFVTTLEDSGPGSLRAAIDAKGPRTVIFRIGGIINLKTPLCIREPFITIAGQTAPGDGICLKGSRDTLMLSNTHDVIIRYLRVRTGYTGEKADNEGDCISCYSADNFILDHCSTSWGTDETISCTQTCDRYTVQWCLMAEGLNYHGHSMGSILGGDRSTWHHNLYAHCRTRNPRFAGACRCDFRNNVVYDWGDACSYGDFRLLNYVNNVVKPGPSTTQRPRRFFPNNAVALPGSLFLRGNVLDGSPEIDRDNRLGTGFETEVFAEAPHAAPAVESQAAEAAYELVLKNVGAMVPKRDTTDTRIVAEVRGRTGKIIRYERELGDWPSYAGGAVPLDLDGDGIPDDWETAHGLNPNDTSDAGRITQTGYTNLECYLNSLVPRWSGGRKHR
jgi:pectate lyase